MEYLILFSIGFLGVLTHCLFKAKKLIEDAEIAGLKFTLKDYFRKDRISISISFLSIILWLFLFGETIAIYPKLESFLRWSFAGMGLTGSYFIQSFRSASKRFINNFIDEKTNELQRLKE